MKGCKGKQCKFKKVPCTRDTCDECPVWKSKEREMLLRDTDD